MTRELYESIAKTGRIINAQGQSVDAEAIMGQAVTIYGDRLVMQAIARAALGDTSPVCEILETAMDGVLSDIELEIRP